MNTSAQFLSDLTCIDLGAGMPPALISKFLSELGMRVVHAPPQGAGKLSQLYPAYQIWRRDHIIEAEGPMPARARMLVKDADVCIVGGEDFPGIQHDVTPEELLAVNPRLVILRITGYPPCSGAAARPAVEILAQARSGLTYEQYSDRPIYNAYRPATYGAVFQGLIGILAALYDREATGRGQIVSTSLFEGTLGFAQAFSADADRPTRMFNFTAPKDPVPLIVRCSDGIYVHIVLGSAGAKYKLYKALGINDPTIQPNDNGLPAASDPPSKFFGDLDFLSPFAERLNSKDLLDALWADGVIASKCMKPGECWDHLQVGFNGLIAQAADGTRHVGNPLIATLGHPNARGERVDNSLSGLRVVDFGAFVAGPLASVPLVDLGADVIKIEPPQGDQSRSLFSSFSSANRGKKSICLDLKTQEGREAAVLLCAGADVVTSNFRPGVAKRLGIDAETLRENHPGLVVLETPGYGSSGPMSGWAAFDPVVQAFVGHESYAGGSGNPPLWNRSAVCDYSTGFLGAVGLLAALYFRRRTGSGCSMELPLLNGAIYSMSEFFQHAGGVWEGGATVNSTQTGIHPAECMYKTRSGWIAIAARGEDAATAFSSALGLVGILPDTCEAWGMQQQNLIASKMAELGCDEALSILEQHGVWAERCLRFEETGLLTDAEFIKAGTVVESDHPEFGTVRVPGPLFRFSQSQTLRGTRAPLLGEHTEQVLASIDHARLAHL